MSVSEVYKHPRYYAIGYRWNTELECDFLEACMKRYGPAHAARLLDIGCGTGRHLIELATRGYRMTGIDLQPEMVAYARAEAERLKAPVEVSIGDLRHLTIEGPYDAAYCLMDTFRFLLTNEQIVDHLRAVAQRLVSGGLYILDFWVPRQWDLIANEIHQWEQAQGETTVRVFYLQHPESIDPIQQTFDDELVFEVREGDQVQEIRGGPTRTRLLMPQEFRALVDAGGGFQLLSTHGEFDLTKSLDEPSLSWRMISILRRIETS